MTTVHLGKTITQDVVGSDGPLAPGALSVTSNPGNLMQTVVDPTTNKVRLQPLTVGQTTVTYHAAGHQDAMDIVTILAAPPLPNLVVTDGPEV